MQAIPVPDFWQMMPALIEICNALRCNGNPAHLDPVVIWQNERRGVYTDLETGEQKLIDKEVRETQ